MKQSHAARATAVALVSLAIVGCGRSATDTADSQSGTPATAELTSTTPPASRELSKLTWAMYRSVGTLDPIQAFDYPENTVITTLCESLQRQAPDGTIGPGLADLSHPDDKTLVITLRGGARFWDGKPVTAEDVAFSLKRAADPKGGGFFASAFARVASIEATSDKVVTVKLRAPDYWLDGDLSQRPGVVVQKAYAEAKGRAFGTPKGGIMCSGPFKVGDWKPGAELTVVRNDEYWDPSDKAKVGAITFKGVPDESSLTSGLLTGGINGFYLQAPIGTFAQLKASDKVTVSQGPSFATDALVISSIEGAFKDVRVRQALSLAIDREAYIAQFYHGTAQLPRTLANPGTWGYAREVFQADWDKLADPVQDLAKAKALMKEAGASGQTITIGMSSEVASINTTANAVRSAGEAIGLNVKFRAVSAQDYINFFTDPKARAGVDLFPTINYPNYADPAALYSSFVLADGVQNFSGFEDPEITAAMDQARSTADPAARAKLVAQAGDLIQQQLPWIPMAQPYQVLVTSSDVTGAPSSFNYMNGPWANHLGGR